MLSKVAFKLRKRATSPVSSESPRAAADLSEADPTPARTAAQPAGRPDEPLRASRPPRATSAAAGRPAPDPHLDASDFGANQWLVEELYQRYLADPGSVDQAWWSFFSDYRPNGTADEEASSRAETDGAAPARAANGSVAQAAAAPAAPAPPRPAPPAPEPSAPRRAAPAPPAPAPLLPRRLRPVRPRRSRRSRSRRPGSAADCGARPPGRPRTCPAASWCLPRPVSGTSRPSC